MTLGFTGTCKTKSHTMTFGFTEPAIQEPIELWVSCFRKMRIWKTNSGVAKIHREM